MIMNRVPCRLGRRWMTLAIAGIAVMGVLTACSASPENARPQGGGMATAPAPPMKDGVGAPAPEFGPPPPADAERDVVKTASMTITVSNTSEAADKAAVLAEEADGRVDSRSEDAGSEKGLARTAIVLRVPVAKLDEVVRELKTLGTVQNAETRSEDVTAQRVDLDARIKALQTSVDRLLAVMRDAKDPDALIKAEGALRS
jgi:type IV secretory pathway VirB10-like protein